MSKLRTVPSDDWFVGQVRIVAYDPNRQRLELITDNLERCELACNGHHMAERYASLYPDAHYRVREITQH